ncbi:hypothetical protein Gotur_007017 [Gossypium turneri]
MPTTPCLLCKEQATGPKPLGLSELDEFGMEGIPHFAFLNKNGNEEGNVAGRLPRKYLQENVDALARGEPSVPHARVVGQYSSAKSRKVH